MSLIVRDALAYVGNQAWQGRIEEVELPEIEFDGVEVNALGLLGGFEAAGSLQPLSGSMTFYGFDADLMALISNPRVSQTFLLRGSQERVGASGVVDEVAVAWTLEPRFLTQGLGTLNQEDALMREFEFHTNTLLVEVAGRERSGGGPISICWSASRGTAIQSGRSRCGAASALEALPGFPFRGDGGSKPISAALPETSLRRSILMTASTLDAAARRGFPRTKTLPVSGIVATALKLPQGRDMVRASKIATGKGGYNAALYQFALFCQVIRFGDNQTQWRVDQIEELAQDDIEALGNLMERAPADEDGEVEDGEVEDGEVEDGEVEDPAPLSS